MVNQKMLILSQEKELIEKKNLDQELLMNDQQELIDTLKEELEAVIRENKEKDDQLNLLNEGLQTSAEENL